MESRHETTYSDEICDTHGLTRFKHRWTKASNGKYYKQSSCMLCFKDFRANLRRRRKLEAIDYKGGHCCMCGESFKGRPEVFVFHHRDPTEKEVKPSSLMYGSWDKIMVELDKCDLLCANCHRSIHSGADYEGIN